MHADWSSYWPGLEYWISWPSIIALLGASGGVAIGFFRSRTDRVVGLGLLAVVLWYAIALTSSQREKPERDYAFFAINPQQAQVIDGKVKLFGISTGTLVGVKICFAHTSDYQNGKYLACLPPIDFNEGEFFFTSVEMGDYTIDIDTNTRLGKVRQRLDIVENNGKGVVDISRVQRKETGEVVCEIPSHDHIKRCT
jgi:hypothetical protein